jgi:hypothetical protein
LLALASKKLLLPEEKISLEIHVKPINNLFMDFLECIWEIIFLGQGMLLLATSQFERILEKSIVTNKDFARVA